MINKPYNNSVCLSNAVYKTKEDFDKYAEAYNKGYEDGLRQTPTILEPIMFDGKNVGVVDRTTHEFKALYREKTISKLSNVDEYYIWSFQKLLRENGYLLDNYSFIGRSDNCVCLEKINDGWNVYTDERGIPMNEKQFDFIKEAFCYMVQLTSSTVQQVEQMQNKITDLF